MSRRGSLRDRRFELRPGDRRFAHIGPSIRKVRFRTPDAQSQVVSTIQSTLKKALNASYTHASKAVHKTHLNYWRDFCAVAQLDAKTCFSAGVSMASTTALAAEANILGAFMAFIIMNPRRSKTTNTTAYAMQIVSTVRA